MIGLVPQELHTDAFETVWRRSLSAAACSAARPTRPIVEKVLRDLSLWDKRKAKIMELSGGMKRRVMIAKALSHEPDILFLDEPTAGVDVELRRDMWELVRQLRDERRHHHPHHPLYRGGRGDGRPGRRDQQGRADPGRGEGRADEEARQEGADPEPHRVDGRRSRPSSPTGTWRSRPTATNCSTCSTPMPSGPASPRCSGG